MMERTLASAAAAVNGRLVGADARFEQVSTDTRTLERGALFVALRGQRHDGHRFVDDAAVRGAVGAIVSTLSDAPLAQILVDDTLKALGALARAWRASFSIPVVAVTGSAGKTTVKELIAAILAVGPGGRGRRVCVTEGNLNNEIGLPLTLMRLSSEHEAAVVELGANHPGEIDRLARIAQPSVGVITNAGPAHLEGFGSIDGVAKAKGELLDHLPPDGTAVLNADDPHVGEWRARSRANRVLTFGRSNDADFTVIGEPSLGEDGARFTMRTPSGEIDIALPLLGPTNVVNALAAAAAAHAVGCGNDEIAAGLSRAAAVRGRMNAVRGRKGALVIDDAYNANPSSARAALDFLAARSGTRIFVLGDMLELGPTAPKLHAEIGEYAKGRCDELVTIGPLSRRAAEAFGDAAESYADAPDAARALDAKLAPGVTVLVKGSRAMGLERVVAALEARNGEGSRC
ncbi:MAG: UDP-N-acetylmuramoyl-tripeptide--D-alanyl-D-alanine ligase [Gammaproteobacteria bacterium]